MAYDFTAASSQYLSTANAPITNFPCTIACWYRIKSTSISCVLISLDSGATSRIQLSVNGITTPKRAVQLATVDSSGNIGIVPVNENSYNINTWYHACGVYENSTTLSSYFNGLSGISTGGSGLVSVTGINKILIGSRTSAGTIGGYHDGNIAEVGIWNAALTAAEVASLAKGMTCDKVRPQSLVFYAPLVRDLIDAKGGRTITNNNGATVANHPQVYA
jgi:hypothetical protein